MKLSEINWDNYDRIYDLCAGYDQLSGGIQTYKDALNHLFRIAKHYKSAGVSACIEVCAIAYYKPKTLLMTGQTRSGKVVTDDKGRRAIVDPAFWTYLPIHGEEELDALMREEATNPGKGQKIFRRDLKLAHPDSDVWKINWTKVKNITLMFSEFGVANKKKILMQVKEKKRPSEMDYYAVQHEAKSSELAVGAKNLKKFIDNLPAITAGIHQKWFFVLDLSSSSRLDQRFAEAEAEKSQTE
jgi:hypothetical protein